MENRADILETFDDKYSKRRSQNLRLLIRCISFVFVSITTVFLRFRYRSIFQFAHDHHLQSYVNASFLRNEYLKWFEEFQNSPLIPRMLPNEKAAFYVADSSDEARTFFKVTKPPFLVLYYANWCPHSARAIPVVQEFAKTELRVRQIPLMALEEDNPLSDKIPGFPTLYLYIDSKDGRHAIKKEFTGKMLVANLVTFLNQHVKQDSNMMIKA